mgnify:FL=1
MAHPGAVKMALAQLGQLAWFGGLVLSAVGKSFLPPTVVDAMAANPMAYYGGLFAVNVASGKLINTGAFEVSYDDHLVWSKIETGRFPTLPELKEKRRECPAALAGS